MLPVDPRDRRVIQAALHYAALRYIETHESQHLDEEQLIEACAAYLMADHQVDDVYKAHALAMAALAEFEARTHPAWVDISLSTAFVVRVVNPVSGEVACFTASELIRLAEQRAQTRATAPMQGTPRRTARKVH